MKLKCFWVQPLHAVSDKFLSCEDNYQQASTDVSNSSIRNATAGKPDVSCDLLFTQPDSIRGPSLTGRTKHNTSGTSPHDTQVESRQTSAQGCASAAGFVELATESKQDDSSAHVSQLPKYISKNSQTTVFLHHKSAIPFSINGNGPLFPHADLETRPSQATDYWKFPGTLEASAAAPNRRDFSAALFRRNNGTEPMERPLAIHVFPTSSSGISSRGPGVTTEATVASPETTGKAMEKNVISDTPTGYSTVNATLPDICMASEMNEDSGVVKTLAAATASAGLPKASVVTEQDLACLHPASQPAANVVQGVDCIAGPGASTGNGSSTGPGLPPVGSSAQGSATSAAIVGLDKSPHSGMRVRLTRDGAAAFDERLLQLSADGLGTITKVPKAGCVLAQAYRLNV